MTIKNTLCIAFTSLVLILTPNTLLFASDNSGITIYRPGEPNNHGLKNYQTAEETQRSFNPSAYYERSNSYPKAQPEELFEKAKAGDITAMNDLGTILAQGFLVKRNYPEAFKLFKNAALISEHHAMYNLGTMFRYGQGTRANPVEAYAWYTLAVKYLPKNAYEKIAYYERQPQDIAETLNPAQLKKAEKLIAKQDADIRKRIEEIQSAAIKLLQQSLTEPQPKSTPPNPQ